MTNPIKTTIFEQLIGKRTYIVEIPQSKVTMIIDRVDKNIIVGDLIKAKEIIKPYIKKKTKSA